MADVAEATEHFGIESDYTYFSFIYALIFLLLRFDHRHVFLIECLCHSFLEELAPLYNLLIGLYLLSYFKEYIRVFAISSLKIFSTGLLMRKPETNLLFVVEDFNKSKIIKSNLQRNKIENVLTD